MPRHLIAHRASPFCGATVVDCNVWRASGALTRSINLKTAKALGLEIPQTLELLAFPGRHDDQVDALTQGLAWGRYWGRFKVGSGTSISDY